MFNPVFIFLFSTKVFITKIIDALLSDIWWGSLWEVFGYFAEIFAILTVHDYVYIIRNRFTVCGALSDVLSLGLWGTVVVQQSGTRWATEGFLQGWGMWCDGWIVRDWLVYSRFLETVLWLSSLEKCLFNSFAYFLSGFFVFLDWSCVNSLYILEIKPLSKISFVNMFSHMVGSLLILMLFSLAMQKLFIWMKPYLFILSFMSLALGDISVKILLCGISKVFLPMFSLRIFMVSWFIFKSFIHLEFIFVHGVSWWSSFIFFLHVAVQISQHHLLKRLFLLHFMLLPHVEY